jgi:hypothetical protein
MCLRTILNRVEKFKPFVHGKAHPEEMTAPSRTPLRNRSKAGRFRVRTDFASSDRSTVGVCPVTSEPAQDLGLLAV